MSNLESNLIRSIEDSNIGVRHFFKVKQFYEEIKDIIEKRDIIYDVCSGNGLFGFYYSLLNKDSKVIQIDINQTNKYNRLQSSLDGYSINCEFIKQDVRTFEFDDNSFVCGIHTCGVLFNDIVMRSIDSRVSFALMPCCHKKSRISRTHEEKNLLAYATNCGYEVNHTYIDSRITDNNKIFIGIPQH